MAGQAQRVYDAENRVCSTLDWANSSEVPVKVSCFGSSLTIPVERKFGDLLAVRRYTDLIIDSPEIQRVFGPIRQVEIVERKTNHKAHYQAGTIALYSRGRVSDAWAMREAVVLHELAHHLARGDSHEDRFAGVLLYLFTDFIGPEVGLMLTEAFAHNRVNWIPVTS